MRNIFFPPSREDQIETLKELGESQVRYLLANPVERHPDFDRHVAEEWLRQREQSRSLEASDRRDAREIEMLKIAKKASSDARSARIIAIIAAAIAAMATIISAIIKVTS